MKLDWEEVCNRKTWNALTDDERAAIVMFNNKDTFTVEEVAELMSEQRKYIASRFEGPSTLISNKVCEVRVLNSNEYSINLRIALRASELKKEKA